MPAPPTERLLTFARELQRAETFRELLLITRSELASTLGYQHAWVFVAEDDEGTMLRLLDVASSIEEQARDVAPVLKVKGDAMLEEMMAAEGPVVVEDARTDPRTNKEIVAVLGNRTIINVPLRFLDRPIGALGTGTFGDEGCRPPTRPELDYLIGMAGQLAVAAARIRFIEERTKSEAALRKVEDQLRQSQKMEAVGRLAGGIAHDFNNLLSVVMSYSEMLLDAPVPPATWRHDVGEILRASERAAALTRRLLSFSRQQVITPRVIDLNEVLESMEAMIRRLIGEDIGFAIEMGRPLSRVRIDPGVVEQVLMNLVVNARDAMLTGGELLVETTDVTLDGEDAAEHVDLTPGTYVMIAVSDTGAGMDAETQERIFEPFFTTKDKGRGTGLGLSTVYGLVKQSGGSIRVRSEVGNGTTISVYFPATDAPATPAPAPSPPVTAADGSETILLVEDEAPLRAVVREILERHGYAVIEARDAEHALQIGASMDAAIDLLLTDVVMPGISGGELVERFTALRPETAVLYMSGYTETAMAHHRGMAAGLALLPKPITPDVLLRSVREVLDGVRAGAA